MDLLCTPTSKSWLTFWRRFLNILIGRITVTLFMFVTWCTTSRDTNKLNCFCHCAASTFMPKTPRQADWTINIMLFFREQISEQFTKQIFRKRGTSGMASNTINKKIYNWISYDRCTHSNDSHCYCYNYYYCDYVAGGYS